MVGYSRKNIVLFPLPKKSFDTAVQVGGKYLVFLSSRSVKMSNSSTFSVCIFLGESVFIFQIFE